jgi:hypothetical protein
MDRRAARGGRYWSGTNPRYISEIPLVSDYLQGGVFQFDQSIEDYLVQH